MLLRFYERKSFVDVGGALGLTEEGARKRVSRAVEKLRRYFAQRGYPAATSALVEAMKIHTVSVAPASVAAAQAIAAPSAAALATDVMHMIKRTRLVRITAVALGASAAAAAVCIAIAIAAASRPAQAQSQPDKPLSLPAIRIVPSATTLPATQPTSLTIDQVIAGVQTAEKAFTNLYIKDFRTTIDALPPGEIVWKSTPMVDAGSAWYDGDALGKQRVYFSENVMPWEPGPGAKAQPGDASWCGQEVDYSWDGREGHEVRVTGGFAGQRPVRDNTAMITADRSMVLDSYARYETGAGLTLQYWVTNEEQDVRARPRQLLSEQLAAGAARGRTPELSRQAVNGFDTVRLRWRSPVGMGEHDLLARARERFRGCEAGVCARHPQSMAGRGYERRMHSRKPPRAFGFPCAATRSGKSRGLSRSIGDSTSPPPMQSPTIRTSIRPFSRRKSPLATTSSTSCDTDCARRFYVLMPDGSEQEIHVGDAMPLVKGRNSRRRPDAKELRGQQEKLDSGLINALVCNARHAMRCRVTNPCHGREFIRSLCGTGARCRRLVKTVNCP